MTQSAMFPYNIAYILTPVEFGGSEKVNILFLSKVDKNIFSIYPIVLIRPWENENPFLEKLSTLGYQFFQVPVAKKPRTQGRDYIRILRCYKMVYSILAHSSWDLVHTHGYFADIVAIPIAKLLKIPVISTCHGYISYNKKLALYNSLDRFFLKYSDKVIAVSEGIKNDLKKSKIKDEKIHVIQNTMKINEANKQIHFSKRMEKRNLLNIGDQKWVIGYVGRLSEEKGLKHLIEAAGILRQSGTQLTVLIIGEGPQEDELKNLVKEKGLEDTVIFTGFQMDIKNWLPAIDIFVLPSLTEGTPVSLLEAMGYGIPVVATAVGGVPQLITSGENGILVSPSRPEEIVRAVISLLGNGKLLRSISKAARKTMISKFNIGDWKRQIECLYKEVVDR